MNPVAAFLTRRIEMRYVAYGVDYPALLVRFTRSIAERKKMLKFELRNSWKRILLLSFGTGPAGLHGSCVRLSQLAHSNEGDRCQH
jgi:hypothetical protein